MSVDLSKHKTCIFGIQESGKTYWARTMYKKFRHPIVFQVNEDDGWEKLTDLYVFKANRTKVKEDFEAFKKLAYENAKKGKIDLIIIDEADMFFQGNWDLDPIMTDLVLNHRHIGDGVALWFITRRPQDIPTKVVESSKHLVIFKLEGKNAIDRFREIHPMIPELVEQLDFETHDFVYKELGKEPILCPPLKK